MLRVKGLLATLNMRRADRLVFEIFPGKRWDRLFKCSSAAGRMLTFVDSFGVTGMRRVEATAMMRHWIAVQAGPGMERGVRCMTVSCLHMVVAAPGLAERLTGVAHARIQHHRVWSDQLVRQTVAAGDSSYLSVLRSRHELHGRKLGRTWLKVGLTMQG